MSNPNRTVWAARHRKWVRVDTYETAYEHEAHELLLRLRREHPGRRHVVRTYRLGRSRRLYGATRYRVYSYEVMS